MTAMLVPRLTYFVPKTLPSFPRIEIQPFNPAKRYSMYRFFPSIQPNSASPLPFWVGFGETHR